MWDSESESFGGRDHHHQQYGSGDLSTTSKQGLKTDGFQQRGKSWFVTTDIPSDLLVQIGDVNFHLHTYPLISRSGKLNRIICENSANSGSDRMNRVILDDLPGGADAFELSAKFCYGIAVDLTASNISGLRCASEYLEMTEDLEEGNLIFKTEAFLSYVVLSSWRDSIVVLKSCEYLSPWAENLQIVRRCSESIAWKACANPKGIRWAYTGSKPPKGGSVPVSVSGSSPKWNSTTDHTISPSRSQAQPHHLHHHHHHNQVTPPPDWWFEDVSILRIDHFVRVITAIKVKGMRPDLIGASVMHYASKWLPPGLVSQDHHPSQQPSPPPPMMNMVDTELSWKKEAGLHLIVCGTGKNSNNNNLNSEEEEEEEYHQARDQRMIIESLISIIPPQKDSVTCSFLLRLLRMANMLKVAPALVTELEKRVGMQFEQATLTDLLVPCYNNVKNTPETTLYDTDLMRRLLDHFLVQEQTADQTSASPSRPDSLSADKGMLHELLAHSGGGSGGGSSSSSKARVARIVDSYLTEVAKDRNLSLTKFLVLAETLPQSARSCDDGLYRAIDSYLKAHPTLSEHERKRLCRVMDCQKLSVDARMHAAQNERLPLRVVVQVLFSEQVKISNAININEAVAAEGGGHYQPMIPNRRRTLLEGAPQSFQEGWAGAKKDINTLKFELETVKTKYVELQNEMENLQRQFDKLSKQSGNNKVAPPSSSGWASGWKKLSKFTKMSTVESQEQEVGTHGQHSRKTARRWRNSIS